MVTLEEIKEMDAIDRNIALRKWHKSLKSARRKDKAQADKIKEWINVAKRKAIQLSWVDMIRDMKTVGKSDKEIVNVLFQHGVAEEKRITEQLKRRREEYEQNGTVAGEPQRAGIAAGN